MAHNIFIPKLGMTMEEGKILEWNADDGEWVEKNRVVLVIETEKVAHEIEATISGFLIILAEVDTVLPCGEVAGVLTETKEDYEELKKDQAVPEKKGKEAQRAELSTTPRLHLEGIVRVNITPVAKKLAKEFSIDIAQIQGSGKEGLIVKEDIVKTIEAKKKEAAQVASERVYEGKKVREVIPLSGMRKVIAEHMHRSLSESAQITLWGEVDMTEMIRLRTNFAEKEDKIGVRVTYTDLFIFLVTKVLQEVPIFNSSLTDGEIKVWDDINIGVAVSLELGPNRSGLVVPVIKQTNKKTLKDISSDRKELMGRARDGKLTYGDTTDGTFTINNTGVFGLDWQQTPIINQPEVAILGITSIVERPVVIDGEVVIRSMMPICLTTDHRVIDGGPAGNFVKRLKELITDPYEIFL